MNKIDPGENKYLNNFTLTIGTENGSGSTTSNLTLIRALFKMGIPVSGKNLYPSNIQGMPTWFVIRVNGEGDLARKPHPDIVIAMCEESFEDDVALLPPDGVLIYNQDIRKEVKRDDIYLYPLPVKSLVKEQDVPHTLRSYVSNMVYVGAAAWLLGIDPQEIYGALNYHFNGKEKPLNLNNQIVEATMAYCAENMEKSDPYRVERLDATEGMTLISGNEAAAIGAAFGGIQFAAWYPITPATGIAEMLNFHLPRLRVDPETEKNTFAVVQAEDELAAIGMTVGAGWGGLRAMTSTSGPGLSLMAEFVSLAYFSETPVVIWDVQRVGPSTGLPTRTSQGDINTAYYLGHGDTENILLIPGSVSECFEFGWKAFDIAERYQTPVMVMSDLDLGVNLWMTEPFEYPDQEMDRGKVLWEEDLENWEGEWGRYLDLDGDGIPYRTLPGNQHPKSAWFARGTGHDTMANYSEDPDDWYQNMERIKRKLSGARENLPQPQIDLIEGAEIGLIGYGTTDPPIQEARKMLQSEGIKSSYCRLRAVPFSESVHQFVQSHQRIYVVEMNRDGQMHSLLRLDLPESAIKLISTARLDGLPLTAEWVADQIRTGEEK